MNDKRDSGQSTRVGQRAWSARLGGRQNPKPSDASNAAATEVTDEDAAPIPAEPDRPATPAPASAARPADASAHANPTARSGQPGRPANVGPPAAARKPSDNRGAARAESLPAARPESTSRPDATARPERTERPERAESAPPKASAVFKRLQDNVEKVLRGKHEPIRLAIACLLAEGHLLIEDKPGTGKTSLARAIAASIGGTARRIQFTPDLLPSDITGVTIYDPSGAEFRYRPGPVFSNIVVADEINRASPKTQAALLEVMEERQVTADGVSRPVPRPFMVVATQNPLDFHGTYPLPEVQLDRFAMKISLGYTDRAAELEVMAGRGGSDPVASLDPVISDVQLQALINAVRSVSVAEPLREYVSDIVMLTRSHRDLRLGVSTRGTLTLLAVARAYAVSEGRTFVTPDDMKAIVAPVLVHRMAVTPEAELDGITEADVLAGILESVLVPRSRPAP